MEARFSSCLGVLVAAGLFAGCGGSSSSGPAAIPFDRFQPAEVVIGQPDFTSNDVNQGGNAGANTLGEPFGRPVVVGTTLYLADEDNNRVLGFDPVPTTNGASADFVLGQPDFMTASDGTAADRFNYPGDVLVDGGKLLVADGNNARVLVWNDLPTSNVPADVVVGQPDATTVGSGPTQSILTRGSSVAVAAGKLFVADGDSNRVLIWNQVPSQDGVPADVVLGQPDFTSSDMAITAAGMYFPLSVASDGTHVVVADADNNRVLIWNQVPTQNGTSADVVLGQSDFTSSDAGATARGLDRPEGVSIDGGRLYVADSGNNRVLIYDSIPTANEAAADEVLGQSDFDHVAANDDDQDGTPDATASARTFDEPAAVHADGNRLFVTDFNNNRVLIFLGR